MKLNLKEMMDDVKLVNARDALIKFEPVMEALKKKIDSKKTLVEGVLDLPDSGGNIEADFAEATKRLEAARRALQLVNKLPAGPSRGEHSKRIFKNMNQIRGLVMRIQRALANTWQEREPDGGGSQHRPMGQVRQ